MAVCFIVPPHILSSILENGSPEERLFAQTSLDLSKKIREDRHNLLFEGPKESNNTKVANAKIKDRVIYTAENTTDLPGTEIGKEGSIPNDTARAQAYNGTGATYDLYLEAYKRNSIDNKGMSLISTVHYSQNYDNAFWDGGQMVYGDGDGRLFTLFTRPIDVTGHELTHGVTQYSANLNYQQQSGALNESFSDVFGILVKQRALNQDVSQADWLIGEGIFTDKVNGKALRSMKAPGTAYNDPVLSHDPQPADMDHFVSTTDDNGGVHINSGIPNRAFYLAASAIGGYAWEKAGLIWYLTLTQKLQSNTTFIDCANATIEVAEQLYGVNSNEVSAVSEAWKEVEVL